MQINLYNFTKRKNSTARPGDVASVRSANLKSSTSLINPTFEISGNISEGYNYVMAFGRYYFISNKTSQANGIIELDCTMDYLATFKDIIQNTSAYILYDTTSNIDIPDSRLSVKNDVVTAVSVGNLRSDFSTYGICVCSLLSSNQVGSYAISSSDVQKLMPDWGDVYKDYEDTDNPFSAAAAFIKSLQYSGQQATDYVKSIKWVPIEQWGSGAGDQVHLRLGSYDLGIVGVRVKNRSMTETNSVEIPWRYKDWRNTSPYAEVHVYIPFIGHVSIPASQIAGSSHLWFTSCIDPVSGDMNITMSQSASDGGTNVPIGMYSTNIASDMMAGKTQMSASSIITGAATVATAAVTGNVAALIGGGLSAIQPTASTIGGIGSYAAVGQSLKVQIMITYHNTIVEPSSVSAVMGTPACAVKRIGNLSGYVQTFGASVSMQATDTEIQAVNSMLDAGFYLE